MNNRKTEKFIIGLVVLLVIANITSISIFWLGQSNPKTDRQKGTPAAFLITALNLDKKQQEQLEIFRQEHKEAAEPLREQLVKNKKIFFELLQQTNVSDSQIVTTEKVVAAIIVKLDLLAFDHFKKVRKICTKIQKEKFDKIILQVAQILGNPGDPHPPGDKPPPPNDADANKAEMNEQADSLLPPKNN